MATLPDRIGSLVLSKFEQLPPKRKPAVRTNGTHEWIPLSGIVAQDKHDALYCLSLATGMKCLPQAKLPQAQGNVLHDWHAEVLAIRAFNRFILEECKSLATGTTSRFLRQREVAEKAFPERESSPAATWHGQPFAWREDVRLHMFCTEAPCGDASMELTMAAQEDDSPWEMPAPPAETDSTAPLSGRAYFSALGAVRRKPARGDAPPTLSKSCSDKLSLRQCTSLLSCLTALLVSPEHVYIDLLVMPESEFSAKGCARAFSDYGRMAAVLEHHSLGISHIDGAPSDEELQRRDENRRWCGGYMFQPFTVVTTTGSSNPRKKNTPSPPSFHFSRRAVAARAAAETPSSSRPKTAASNLAVAWVGVHSHEASKDKQQGFALEEATLGGIIQGRKAADGLRAASFASRRLLWALAAEVCEQLTLSSSKPPSVPSTVDHDGERAEGLLRSNVEVIRELLQNTPSYGAIKQSPLLEPRRQVKRDVQTRSLRGWVRNEGDDEFGLG